MEPALRVAFRGISLVAAVLGAVYAALGFQELARGGDDAALLLAFGLAVLGVGVLTWRWAGRGR